MDFATALPGSTSASFHDEGSRRAIARDARAGTGQKRLRKSQSQGFFGTLSPLVSLVRDPVGTLGNIVETLGAERQDDGVSILEEREKQAEGERRLLYFRMRTATTYDEWRTCAAKLDRLEGNHAWRENEPSTEYDYALVAARSKQLDEARINFDLKRMMFLIRTSLTRGLGGMGDLRLYKHSHLGTKALIERYIESCKATISAVVELSGKFGIEVDVKKVMDEMLCARQAFGRSALLLSGGGTFGMNHIGVVKALWEEKLLPRIISGSSAGSIVCAVLCTRTDEEIPQTIQDFCFGDLAVFERGEDHGVLRKVARFLKSGALFDIENLVRVMKNLLGDMTFQEAYNRTRRILNICVSSEGIYELPRILNYITSPNVIIWSAVAASCSVPLIFSPATLLAKDPRTGLTTEWNGPSSQRWIDGSVDNDLPMTRLAEMFNVNHFIVSQVNPHVVPFLAKEEDAMTAKGEGEASAVEAGSGWLYTMANFAKGEALHRMHVLAEMGIFPNYMTKARSVLSQRYSGDITILPAVSYAQFPRVLQNPDTEFMQAAMLCGERATWPKLSRISNHCAIELALDEAVHQLRSRVAFSPSQVDLRMAVYASRDDRTRDLRRHRPARSFEHDAFVVKERRSQKQLRLSTPKRKGPLHHPTQQPQSQISFKSAPPDIPSSSAAETDHDSGVPFTSDDESDASTSLDSPPDLIPSAHLPFRSQPATPSIASKAFISTATSPLAMTTAPKQMSSIHLSSMPSEAEKAYKRLFHPPKFFSPTTPSTPALMPHAGTADAQAGAQEGEKSRRSFGIGRKVSQKIGVPDLKLDISGTRAMMQRRKSTGNRGLDPPTME